jgi:hypothetical protein
VRCVDHLPQCAFARFTEWGLGQPNDNVDSSHRDCVNLFASTGLWNDRNCNRSTLDYICEMAATQTQPPTKPATNCPTGWLPYSGHCYWFNVTANLDYKLAESYCVSLKSHLVHINDIYENAYIASQYPLAGGSSSATEGSKHFWIGLHKMNPDGVYIWTDGYPVEMTSWRQGEPNSGKHGNNCTEIFVSPSSHLASGFWNNSVCHRRKGVICEQRQDNAPATVAPIPTQPCKCLPRFDSTSSWGISHVFCCTQLLVLASRNGLDLVTTATNSTYLFV